MSFGKWLAICTGGLVLASSMGQAEVIEWPDLPKGCFVSARPATASDIRKGCAVFMLGKGKAFAGEAETSAGTPLNIKIPQYAWHVDEKSGKKAPVVLIQAEEISGVKTVGFKNLDSQSLGVALLSEMILLGRTKPGT